MIGFLFVGEEILNLIGIDVNSFAVAGSIIIFFLALEMILGIQFYKEESPETASIVPIAFPIIAGQEPWPPCSLCVPSLLLQTSLLPSSSTSCGIFVLKSSKSIERFLGSSVSVLFKRYLVWFYLPLLWNYLPTTHNNSFKSIRWKLIIALACISWLVVFNLFYVDFAALCKATVWWLWLVLLLAFVPLFYSHYYGLPKQSRTKSNRLLELHFEQF